VPVSTQLVILALVNDQVVASNWESGDELGQVWRGMCLATVEKIKVSQTRSSHQLLQTSDHIVQEIDSVEYGLTDIQEYYANTGGLKRAAEKQRGKKS